MTAPTYQDVLDAVETAMLVDYSAVSMLAIIVKKFNGIGDREFSLLSDDFFAAEAAAMTSLGYYPLTTSTPGTFLAAGETIEVAISATGPFTIDCPAWLSADPDEGDATTQIIAYTATENTGAERTGNITISAGSMDDVVLEATQETGITECVPDANMSFVVVDGVTCQFSQDYAGAYEFTYGMGGYYYVHTPSTYQAAWSCDPAVTTAGWYDGCTAMTTQTIVCGFTKPDSLCHANTTTLTFSQNGAGSYQYSDTGGNLYIDLITNPEEWDTYEPPLGALAGEYWETYPAATPVKHTDVAAGPCPPVTIRAGVDSGVLQNWVRTDTVDTITGVSSDPATPSGTTTGNASPQSVTYLTLTYTISDVVDNEGGSWLYFYTRS